MQLLFIFADKFLEIYIYIIEWNMNMTKMSGLLFKQLAFSGLIDEEFQIILAKAMNGKRFGQLLKNFKLYMNRLCIGISNPGRKNQALKYWYDRFTRKIKAFYCKTAQELSPAEKVEYRVCLSLLLLIEKKKAQMKASKQKKTSNRSDRALKKMVGYLLGKPGFQVDMSANRIQLVQRLPFVGSFAYGFTLKQRGNKVNPDKFSFTVPTQYASFLDKATVRVEDFVDEDRRREKRVRQVKVDLEPIEETQEQVEELKELKETSLEMDFSQLDAEFWWPASPVDSREEYEQIGIREEEQPRKKKRFEQKEAENVVEKFMQLREDDTKFGYAFNLLVDNKQGDRPDLFS
jgi:hypothetical protein